MIPIINVSLELNAGPIRKAAIIINTKSGVPYIISVNTSTIALKYLIFEIDSKYKINPSTKLPNKEMIDTIIVFLNPIAIVLLYSLNGANEKSVVWRNTMKTTNARTVSIASV